MDCRTYISKCADVIYESVKDEVITKSLYKKILNKTIEIVENEETEKIPYYYISILNVIHELDLEDFVDDNAHERLKSLSKQLTLNHLKYMVIGMFRTHYNEEDLKIYNTIVDEASDIIENNLPYDSLCDKETCQIICDIRTIVYDYVKNVDNFDYSSFDRELTDNMYDIINCYNLDDDDIDIEDCFDDEDFEEDDDESDEEYVPDESDEDDESDEESEDSENEDLHDLLDKKIDEIRELKKTISELEQKIEMMEVFLKSHKENERDFITIMQFWIIGCLLYLISPLSSRNLKPMLEIDFLNESQINFCD